MRGVAAVSLALLYLSTAKCFNGVEKSLRRASIGFTELRLLLPAPSPRRGSFLAPMIRIPLKTEFSSLSLCVCLSLFLPRRSL